MEKLTALRFLFLLISLAFISLFFSSQVYASHKVFNENFDSNIEGAFPSGWVLTSGHNTPCNATWKVVNGMAGIKISNQSCLTSISPNDEKWNNLGNNYIIDLDMKFVNGTDHNIAFRFTNSSKWYDIHFQSPSTFVLERVPPIPPGAVFTSYSIPNRSELYHIKITVQTGKIKMSIDNSEVLYYEYNPVGELEPTGRIALIAGTGADKNSETYFDNIAVTSIDTPLDVPLLKQTDPAWNPPANPIEFDSALSWDPTHSTIGDWGCAITSTTMVLKYYGINTLPDGTALDPGSLNGWLKQNNGYVEGSGILQWSAITSLAKLAKESGNNPNFAYDGLEYVKIKGPDKNQLKTDLDNSHPDILEQKNPQHFIVAKGINGTSFDINDPYHNRIILSDGYADTFASLRRFIPSNTNLSYIWLYVDPTVDILLTNSTGQKLGSDGTTTYSEINQGDYYTETGITNPITGLSAPSIKVLTIPKPTDGNYSISVATTSAMVKQFSLKTYQYTTSGSVTTKSFTNYAKSDEPATFSLSFQQNPPSAPVAPTDTTPPQIKNTKTLDTNNNGKIDTIEVTFVRDVHGQTVNSTGTDFTVDGYDIKKAKEISPGIVQITLDEKNTNDSGTIPILTLKNNNIKDITSDTYNHQQTATPTDGIPPTKPTVDIRGDKYLKPQTVEITSLDTPNTPTIFYTLDGSDPATSSAKLTYTTPVKIDGSLITLKAIAQDQAGNKSDVMTQTYEIAPKIEDASIAVASMDTTSFTITWTTDRPSYSRLVFGTKSKKTKGSDTKYGYDKTTNEASIKQTTHTVSLSGLNAGATYYYRLISRGSPEQVTDERSITLASDPTPTPTQTPTPTPTPTPLVSPEPTAKAETTTTSSSSNTSSTSSNTACNDEKPKSAPTLTTSFAGINTVALSWKEGSGPVSYYLLAYGTEPGKLQYGNPNVGGKGTTSFVVENLSGGQTYYFRVRAGNGCTPGDYSNEISATPIGFSENKPATGFKENVLGATTEKKSDSNLTAPASPSPTPKKLPTQENNTSLITFSTTAALTLSLIALTAWLWPKLNPKFKFKS